MNDNQKDDAAVMEIARSGVPVEDCGIPEDEMTSDAAPVTVTEDGSVR